jgi:hypothetical protein
MRVFKNTKGKVSRMKSYIIVVVILGVLSFKLFSFSTTFINVNSLPDTKGNLYRYDDGSYENAINWFTSKISPNEWHGWGVKFTLSGIDDIKISRIFIAFTKRNEFNSEDAVYNIAICNDIGGFPDTGSSDSWVSEEYQAPQSIPFWNYSIYIEHEVPDLSFEPTFWVLFLPLWEDDIIPDPPFYLCIDTDTWLEGSYGNADQIFWYPLPSIDPKYYAEFGIIVEGTRVKTGITNHSFGKIKSLFK